MEVWQITVSDVSEAQRERLAAVLSAEETVRAERYKRAQDRLRFQIGHGLARLISAAQTGMVPSDLVWQVSETGKPSWSNARLALNLSHSGDQVWLAIGGTAPVGLDVQDTTGRLDVAAVSEIALSPEEQAHLAALDDLTRRERFFDLWVAREAAAKATGQGVFASLRSVSALPLPSPEVWAVAPGLGADLWLRHLSAPAGYRAALAVEQVVPPREPPQILGQEAVARLLARRLD